MFYEARRFCEINRLMSTDIKMAGPPTLPQALSMVPTKEIACFMYAYLLAGATNYYVALVKMLLGNP